MAAGERNAYYCDACRGYVVTIDLDGGVTPMFLACRVAGEPGDANPCDGTMSSMMYPPLPWPDTDANGTPIPTEPTWEWYRPEKTELTAMSPNTIEHVANGGLLLRRVT